MADEQKPKGRKKVIEPETEGGILATTARAIGTVAGKTASLTGIAKPAPAPSTKHAKLQKKNKSRLPRRQKKAQQKAAATQDES